MTGFKSSDFEKSAKIRILYSRSRDHSRHEAGLHVLGFDATAKDHFQACALRRFWAFLLPDSVGPYYLPIIFAKYVAIFSFF